MVVESQFEAVIFVATITLAFAGGVVALAARLLLNTRQTRLVPALFFGSMLLVTLITAVALAAGDHCWISGGGSLLFMSLLGTSSLGPVESSSF